MARRPVIGVTLDSEPAGGYAKLPWYALRENYCDVLADAFEESDLSYKVDILDRRFGAAIERDWQPLPFAGRELGAG